MSRYRYNADAFTHSDGIIDFGASVPFNAQVRPRIVLATPSGWCVRCYRKLRGHNEVSRFNYTGDSESDAEKAFATAAESGHFEYISLVNLTTNTIIKDHSE